MPAPPSLLPACLLGPPPTPTPKAGGSAEADAAELAAVLGRYRAEQDEFCAKLASTSGPAMGIISNASYARHPGVALVGGGGASYVMWTQPRTTDLVSQEIWNSGSWDVNETSAMLDSLREWGQVRAALGRALWWAAHGAEAQLRCTWGLACARCGVEGSHLTHAQMPPTRLTRALR